jgi:hypothetical protein
MVTSKNWVKIGNPILSVCIYTGGGRAGKTVNFEFTNNSFFFIGKQIALKKRKGSPMSLMFLVSVCVIQLCPCLM